MPVLAGARQPPVAADHGPVPIIQPAVCQNKV